MSKVVVVTGAGRGLGRAIVEDLVERDWTVWATDVSMEMLHDSSAPRTAVMDVSDEGSVTETMNEISAAGPIHALVNNAGIFPLAAWDDHELDLWRRVLDVNLLGAYLCSREAARSMRSSGTSGSIVNITSLTFYKGVANGLAYVASKGALIGLTRSLASALGEHGIRVNAVAPGLMRTEGVQELVSGDAFPSDRVQGHDPERRLPGRTEPSRVARVVAFLLGDDAAEITGQVLAADGGTIYL